MFYIRWQHYQTMDATEKIYYIRVILFFIIQNICSAVCLYTL